MELGKAILPIACKLSCIDIKGLGDPVGLEILMSEHLCKGRIAKKARDKEVLNSYGEHGGNRRKWHYNKLNCTVM